MKFICDLGKRQVFHDWGKWKLIGRGETERFNVLTQRYVPTGEFVKQERVCHHCGLKQFSTTEI